MTSEPTQTKTVTVAETDKAVTAQAEDFAELFADQPDLARLLWSLKRARGFALYFARCNVPAYRQQLSAALAALLPRPIVTVDFPPLAEGADPFARAAIDARVAEAAAAAPSDAVIFITGLENLLPSRMPEVMAATLQEVNWRRSAFQKTERPLVFWLPEYALTAMARNAPDLYDWYSGVYELDLPERLRADVARSTLGTIRQKQDQRWLSQDERHRWAEVLHELLASSDALVEANESAADQSNLLSQLGRFYREQGQYAIARQYQERALKIDEAAFGPDHPRVGIRLNNLASVLQDLGELAQARALFERSLKIDEAAFGPDHPSVGTDLNNLALVLQDLGELAQARALFERSLKIDEAAFGPDHPRVGTRLNNLASVLKDLGELAQARALFERALKIDEAAFGPDHPRVGTRLNNLASVLKDLGELAQARVLFERALKINEAAFGSDHPSVGAHLNNLASVLKDLGELAQARALFERALKIDEAAFGPDHPSVGTDLNNLALVLKDVGELAQARALFERGLATYRKFLGDNHPSTKTIAKNLALLNASQPKAQAQQKKRKRPTSR